MRRKRFYDADGNEIRSKPPKAFYQTWWFGLIIIVVVIIGTIKALGSSSGEDAKVENSIETEGKEVADDVLSDENNAPEIEEEPDSSEVIEEVSEEPVYLYEDFKGTYVLFEGPPYESSIEHIAVIEEDKFSESTMLSMQGRGLITRNILEKTTDGSVWTLDLEQVIVEPTEKPMGNIKMFLEYQNGYKFIRFMGEKNILSEPFYSMSNEALYANYHSNEIDYARIIMMTNIPRPEPDDPTISVKQLPAGNPIFNIEGSPTYPENVTMLSTTGNSFSNHDTYTTVYSVQGDGYITLYPQPTKFEVDIEAQSYEDYYELAQEILRNAETVYVDPFEPYLVANFISSVKFYYE